MQSLEVTKKNVIARVENWVGSGHAPSIWCWPVLVLSEWAAADMLIDHTMGCMTCRMAWQKRHRRKVDQEKALDRPDPRVFRSRWPAQVKGRR